MSIKMFDHERAFLERLYLKYRIPIEQFEVRQEELHMLCTEWRASGGRRDSDEDILHYMRTRRKRGLWPRLEGNHVHAPELAQLTADEKEVLIDIFYENVAHLGNGSDNIAYEPEVSAMIATEFLHRTGRTVAGCMLVGILTALRKRGSLPRVRRIDNEEDEGGFEDISLVG